MRLFVAIDMPELVIAELLRLQKLVRALDLCAGTYVHEQGMHVTLKFLGDVADEQVPAIEHVLSEINVASFTCKLGCIDTFKAGENITVIFVALECSSFVRLAHDVDAALAPWCPQETRPFVPHLTLLRVKAVHDRQQLFEALHAIKVHDVGFTIDSFVLKNSELTPQGPVYTDVRSYELT